MTPLQGCKHCEHFEAPRSSHLVPPLNFYCSDIKQIQCCTDTHIHAIYCNVQVHSTRNSCRVTRPSKPATTLTCIPPLETAHLSDNAGMSLNLKCVAKILQVDELIILYNLHAEFCDAGEPKQSHELSIHRTQTSALAGSGPKGPLSGVHSISRSFCRP